MRGFDSHYPLQLLRRKSAGDSPIVDGSLTGAPQSASPEDRSLARPLAQARHLVANAHCGTIGNLAGDGARMHGQGSEVRAIMKTLDLAAVSGTSPPSRAALLTIPQVATVLHCTTQHVRNLIASKALRAIDIGCAGAARRTRRIQPKVLERWLAAHEGAVA